MVMKWATPLVIIQLTCRILREIDEISNPPIGVQNIVLLMKSIILQLMCRLLGKIDIISNPQINV
jgi:hypothetical protein